jgi:rfaE bifunctional protein kinase chain/domain
MAPFADALNFRNAKGVDIMELASSMKERLTGLVRSFRAHRVLVIGDIILDRFIWGDVERISPEAPVPVVVVRREEARLGGAGNVAVNIQALSGNPILVGVVSNDPAGEKIQHELDRLQLPNTGLMLDLGRPTIVKTRVIAAHQQVCRVDRETLQPMSMELFKKAHQFIQKYLAKVGGLLISDYGKGFINQRLLTNVLPMAQRAGKIVAVDPKSPNFSIYRPATILTPNKKEAEAAAGIPIRDDASLKQAAEAILKSTMVENLLITRGEEGMSLFRPTGYSRHIPTFAREVFDVTGAGDTVIATLTLAMCAGANPEEAAILANHAAGIVVGKLGTAAVTPEELIQAIHDR